MERKYFSHNTYFVNISWNSKFHERPFWSPSQELEDSSIPLTEFSKFQKNIDKTQLNSWEQVQYISVYKLEQWAYIFL